MRNIYVTRPRALACFALPYHCFVGREKTAFLESLSPEERTRLRTARTPGTVRSGETICLPVDEAASTLFAAGFLEKGELATEALPIPPGTEDLHFRVETLYDGNRRLSLRLSREENAASGAAPAPEAPEEKPEKRLAVFFPGIGYTADRPLLYYSRRICLRLGYETRVLSYAGLPAPQGTDSASMTDTFRTALVQTEAALAGTDWASYSRILFVGKSIGTSIAVWLASRNPVRDRIRSVLFTPLEETFSLGVERALVFTGTADPWVGGADSPIPALCASRGLPCEVVPDGNHSLETGNLEYDLSNLRVIMRRTEAFMSRPY